MTRCECAETPFAEVVRRLRAGEDLDRVQADTGVGLLCTACLPDLRAHLAGVPSDADVSGTDARNGVDSEPTAA